MFHDNPPALPTLNLTRSLPHNDATPNGAMLRIAFLQHSNLLRLSEAILLYCKHGASYSLACHIAGLSIEHQEFQINKHFPHPNGKYTEIVRPVVVPKTTLQLQRELKTNPLPDDVLQKKLPAAMELAKKLKIGTRPIGTLRVNKKRW